MMNRLLKVELPWEVKSSQQYGSSVKGPVVQLWSQGIASLSKISRMMKRAIGKTIFRRDYGDDIQGFRRQVFHNYSLNKGLSFQMPCEECR